MGFFAQPYNAYRPNRHPLEKAYSLLNILHYLRGGIVHLTALDSDDLPWIQHARARVREITDALQHHTRDSLLQLVEQADPAYLYWRIEVLTDERYSIWNQHSREEHKDPERPFRGTLHPLLTVTAQDAFDWTERELARIKEVQLSRSPWNLPERTPQLEVPLDYTTSPLTYEARRKARRLELAACSERELHVIAKCLYGDRRLSGISVFRNGPQVTVFNTPISPDRIQTLKYLPGPNPFVTAYCRPDITAGEYEAVVKRDQLYIQLALNRLRSDRVVQEVLHDSRPTNGKRNDQ